MKPLSVAPWTVEDICIASGLRVLDRPPAYGGLQWMLDPDRRDAELMHHCTYCRDLPRFERWRGFAVAHVIQRGDCERFAWQV